MATKPSSSVSLYPDQNLPTWLSIADIQAFLAIPRSSVTNWRANSPVRNLADISESQVRYRQGRCRMSTLSLSMEERALRHIDATDRDTWLRVGMALKSEHGEANTICG